MLGNVPWVPKELQCSVHLRHDPNFQLTSHSEHLVSFVRSIRDADYEGWTGMNNPEPWLILPLVQLFDVMQSSLTEHGYWGGRM
jgi:hypothetical protein